MKQSDFGFFPIALFFMPFLAVCHAEFISVSRFRNKFAVTGRQEEILKQVQDDRSHTDYFDKLSNRKIKENQACRGMGRL